MPASDISMFSTAGRPKSQLAQAQAKEAADREIAIRIQNGLINWNDHAAIKREYKTIYQKEYYRWYALNWQQTPQIVYIHSENPSATKYERPHPVARFSRSNIFIYSNRDRVSNLSIYVGRFIYPIDDNNASPETKEALLSSWPGPLDRPSEHVKQNVTNYIENLKQQDYDRRIKYCNQDNDKQRKKILKLLTKLLHRNGAIDASGITRLFFNKEEVEIQKEESNLNPVVTLQKYLILGKRGDAVKFAKSRKLWDHAQCLAFLDKYQPQNGIPYYGDSPKIKDDTIIQLNDEYIKGLNDEILQIIYKSLLNRIQQTNDPESANLIEHPNVGSNEYKFALLSANDCDMIFDPTNELFKLIRAIKISKIDPVEAHCHLISLGHSTLDDYDPTDNISYISSFKERDTPASRTLIISNMDLLILNEIWEYCLNLARGTNNRSIGYNYIINLIPYKLIFASKLLDFGLFGMFADYLSTLEFAIEQSKGQQINDRDGFYDWNSIERNIRYLRSTWEILLRNSEIGQGFASKAAQPPPPPAFSNTFEPPPPLPLQPSIYDFNPQPTSSSPPESLSNDYYPRQRDFEPPNFPEQPDYQQTFSPEPVQSPPSNSEPLYNPAPASSSLLDDRRDSVQSNGGPPMDESFANAYSPINQHDDLHIKREPEPSRIPQPPPGFLTQIVGTAKSLLPKSNSKQMILPDDSNKQIVYDDQRGSWVDTTQPDEAPPMMTAPPVGNHTNYSFAGKATTKSRYPKV